MNRLISFVVLLVFWILWSGMFDLFHLSLGIISVAIVVLWTGDLFVKSKQPIITRLTEWIRFETYLFWLLWEILVANLQVFKLAFLPQLRQGLSPTMVTFKTSLSGDLERFVLAQSITLTPGTVTVKIEDDAFTVHALNHATAAALPGDMEKRVKKIYERRHHA